MHVYKCCFIASYDKIKKKRTTFFFYSATTKSSAALCDLSMNHLLFFIVNPTESNTAVIHSSLCSISI